MKRYFELFFRHPIRFSLPMVVALVAGAGYASRAPRSYSAAATVFTDSSLPNASTLSQGIAQGAVTPSADKLATLQEFLHTQSFLNKVLDRSPLGPVVASQPEAAKEQAAAAMGKTIKVSTVGPQILAISAKSGSPVMAAGTVTAVIDEFTAELGSVLVSREQSLAKVYKAQVDTTSAGLAKAQSALSAYLQTHVASVTDTQETQLTGDVALAQTQHAAALDSYNQATLSQSTVVDPTAFHVIDPPKVPTAPASRKKQLILSGVGGLIGGFVITIIALVLLMSQDRSVREEEDVESTLDLEVVGTVPQFDKGVLSPSDRLRKGEPHEWFWTPPGLVETCTAALRRLEREESAPVTLPRGGLRVSRRTPIAGRVPAPTGLRTIGVTSCLRGEGRSTIAMGMAAAAYQAYGLRTVLVELDFERPSLARRLGIDSSPGVADILRDGVSIEECLHLPDDESVGALVAGDAGGDPSALLSGLLRSSLMGDLGGLFDVVIADLPPLSPAGQAADVAPLLTTVLLVVRSGTAPVGQIRRALDDLDKPPPVIFNGVESSIPRPLRALLAG